MRDAAPEIVGYLLFLACVMLALVALSGCTSKLLEVTAPSQECPRLVLPPVADDVVLDIKGDKVTANAGGDTLLRGYVACRNKGVR